jgi:hypothetical protein
VKGSRVGTGTGTGDGLAGREDDEFRMWDFDRKFLMAKFFRS